MEYTPEMNLVSESGYCMPFDSHGQPVNVIRDYGIPTETSDEDSVPDGVEDIESASFHHGIDLRPNDNELLAMASGKVVALGVNRKEHGGQITIKYDKFEVTYGGLKELNVQFGESVVAGTTVGKCGDILHVGVKYDGEEMNPIDFLTMVNDNYVASIKDVDKDILSQPYIDGLHTNYDKDMDQIEGLMINYLGNYLSDINSGKYVVPEKTELSMRSLMDYGFRKNKFMAQMPSMMNPLGLGEDSKTMIIQAQNLLIADFLNYMLVIQNVSLHGDTASDSKKKTIIPM